MTRLERKKHLAEVAWQKAYAEMHGIEKLIRTLERRASVLRRRFLRAVNRRNELD